ncbi:DNA helicase/exodeoxyribonuclease V, subunit A [Selenomonas sp. GACV-9]|uniref:helicase-exonuclease AddAB subunit AddA n=1 Tax=Selenomonas sp. GACV-9 TaxID=3158782 RepID=UPI0008E1FC69|nr:DNA helicase/exodeoxyribonuclease V, subunit A [Selenomonas ruminantium]
MGFTKDQQKAIDVRDKNILVAAAAGSGKTRVLVERIIKQLMEQELSIDELLVVTFTNAAAAEMRERIEGALQERLLEETSAGMSAWLERQSVLLTGADICTFHSFCQKVIRQYIDVIDVDPQFRLASEQEMVLLKRDVLEELLEQHYERPENEAELSRWEGFLSFADDYGDDKGDDKIYDAVLKLYGFCQSQPYPIAWLRQQQELFLTADSLIATPWFKAMLSTVCPELDAIIREYAALAGIVSDAAPAALQEEWQPYAAAVQEDVEQLKAIRGALRSCEKNPAAGCFDEVCQCVADLKWKNIGAKIFKPLQEDYPEIREAFDAERKKLKKRFNEGLKDRYFCESEAGNMERINRCGEVIVQYTELVIDFIEALQAAKKERNILDFNDLEHYALAILCGDAAKLMQAEPEFVPTEAALSLREQFKAIMVDEYQDTNGVQEAILNLIAREDNRFTVGDVKQSIYRFRLADPYLFQAKYDSYPEQPQADELNQLITMKQNFRSRAEVLAPINYIFDQVMRRDAVEIEYDERSKLYPGANYPAHGNTLQGPLELDLVLQEAAEEQQVPKKQMDETAEDGDSEELEGFDLEAQHIASRIQQLMQAGKFVYDKDADGYRPLELRDIAILLRAVRGKANILLETLRKNGIAAYADVDGGYFEATEVRLVLALLAIIDNARQDIPLAAVLASPIGGFSWEEIVRIRMSAEDGDLYDGLLASFSPDTGLPAELAERTSAFQQELAAWRNYAVSHSVPELIWMLFRETGYYDYVGSLKGGLLRQANLRMLVDRAADYERTNYRGLFRFLRFIDDLRKRDTDLSVARTLGASENVVRIMSIHKSKGLEFPVVFVADMAKEFNLQDTKKNFLMHQQLGIGIKLSERSRVGRQIYNTLPWQAIADKIVAESKAEEMRVLYVAMTRAREKLILTGVLTASKADKVQKKWGKYLQSTDRQMPAAFVRQAASYLDWVAPAIIRHADGEALRQFVADEADGYAALELEPEAHFAVQVLNAAAIGMQHEEELQDDELLRAAALGQPMPATENKERVEHCLAYRYDMGGLDEVPAKLTVTEIKRRFAVEELHEDDTEPGTMLVKAETMDKAVQADFDWPRPQFLQEERQGLSAAEKGTIMHTVMQHIDIHGDMSFAGIRQQLVGMEQAGILLPGQKDVVYLKGIRDFVQSAVGQRLRKAKDIWRELPFSRMLPAKRFYSDVQSPDEKVFTQGVIDLLFEEDDGSLVLIDYKTDQNPDPEQALRRYQVQVDLYSEAVKEILQRPVKERYLYLLRSGQMVMVP